MTGWDAAGLKRAIVEFARAASSEISTHDEKRLPEIAAILPPGMSVYVAHTPKTTLQDVVRVAAKVQALGLNASPHIVARRLPSEQVLKSAVRSLREQGIEQALLVAGDLSAPLGPFTSTLQLIDTGVLQEAGFKRIGVAGHPQGHPTVAAAELLAALKRKQAFAHSSGIAVHIVTQFCFDAQRVCDWGRELTGAGIDLPVHVGIAGPTPMSKLIKFAVQCGVGASMQSLSKGSNAVSQLLRPPAGADEMFIGLVRCRAAEPNSRLILPHLYSFGGAVASANWLSAVRDGRFELHSENTKFTVTN